MRSLGPLLTNTRRKNIANADDARAVCIRCTWPDVSAAALETLFDRFDDYQRFVWAMTDSSIRRQEEDRALVWQRQTVPGTAPREMLVWLSATANASGSKTYTWTTAENEPMTTPSGVVRALRNDGRWEIHPRTEGGVEVVFEILYSPGGWVPDWLVRWCQTLGASRMMNEIRTIALQQP